MTRLFRTPFTRPANPEAPPPAHHVALEGVVKQALETGRTRLVIAAALFAAVFAAVGLRLVDVSVLSGASEPRLAETPRANANPSGRAEIIDHNGLLLATSLATPSLYADPQAVLDPAEAA
ncbi:MAG: penicillin-binding protein 2, partial [Oceanibaculum nanhaiense]